jgi:Cation transport ATPase
VSGIRCASCASTIEQALREDPHVERVVVDILQNEVMIEGAEELTNLTLATLLKNAGYPVVDKKEDIQKIGTARVVLLVIIAFSFLLKMARVPFFSEMSHALQLFLVITAQALAFPIYKSAFNSLKHRALTMDVLIALGATLAFFFSLGEWLFQGTSPHYFETTAVLLASVMVGRSIEERLKNSGQFF